MKVLITTDLYVTETNGVVTSVRNLWEELTKLGHEVRILTLSGNLKSHKEDHVYYIKSIPFGMVYPDVRMPISYRNQLIQELIDWKPDVIHSQCEFFSFQFAKRIAKKTGAPLVHTYHTLYEQYVPYLIPTKTLRKHLGKRFSKRMVAALSRKRLKHVDTVIAPTRKVENSLRQYGLDGEIRVVPTGISIDKYQYRMPAEERAQRRIALGIPEDHQVLLNLGRLGTEKNLNELMALFADLLTLNSKLTFLIVGDGPAKEDLEKQAQDLGIADHVIFTGMVNPSEVQNYYQLGDVFVSASTSETQGLTYIEAAANGLPLVCREDPCLDDVIAEGVNGYEYTASDEFLKEISSVLKDQQWRDAASRSSEEIAATFDKSCFAEKVEDIYEEALEEES
ncbi:MAG: glycosyltransferase family 4 protein [Lachnospiraceae bacterium]|nr:glycosyltransferase family 4 protein [Lachnospiraceae bacterium]